MFIKKRLTKKHDKRLLSNAMHSLMLTNVITILKKALQSKR